MAASVCAAASDFSSLDSLLETRYDDAGAPGAAVIIARGDSVIYERYFGMADIEAGVPVGPESRFCIASISKQFTVMAMLQQLAQHPGLLDRPAAPFFGYSDPVWHGVTLRHLASHTSGLPDARPRSDRNWCVMADEEQSIDYFNTLDHADFGPGEYYDYLNPSFILLAKVTEQLSGRDFYEYVHDSIFDRAGMNHTYYFDRTADGAWQAHGYVMEDGRWQRYEFGRETFYATRPDGGIYSTARDLLKWEKALAEGLIVPDDVRDMAYTPLVSVTASPFCDYQRRPDTWYGLGYFIEHHPGQSVKVYHTGDNGGFQAYLAKYPESDIRIIVLENRNDRSRWQLAEAIDSIIKDFK